MNVVAFFFSVVVLSASLCWAASKDFLSNGDSFLALDKYEEAIKQYKDGIDHLESEDSLVTRLSLYTNLGTAQSSMGQNENAIESYKAAIRAFQEGNKENDDDDARAITAQAAFFLGMVQQDNHQYQQAADSYAFANTLDPLHWASLANLGSVLHDYMKNMDEALIVYNKVIDILTNRETEPTDPPHQPQFILSEIQYRIGMCLKHDLTRSCAVIGNASSQQPHEEASCRELAANAFSQALKWNPDHESAKHMLASMTADATVTRASNDYVKNLFDDYAHNFEHSLVDELQYNGYERLRLAFDRAFHSHNKNPPKSFPLVIDAGCGTGLAGEQFRNISTHLIGVDLSAAIIQQAVQKRPNLYDEVLVQDLAQVFQNKASTISLIVAADSFIYFGDLDPLFESMQVGLADYGFAAFTLENVNEETEAILSENTPTWRWQLTASGRFAHRKAYVEEVSNKYDLSVYHYESLNHFRYENGVGVGGHAFILQKLPESKEEL